MNGERSRISVYPDNGVFRAYLQSDPTSIPLQITHFLQKCKKWKNPSIGFPYISPTQSSVINACCLDFHRRKCALISAIGIMANFLFCMIVKRLLLKKTCTIEQKEHFDLTSDGCD